MAHPYHGLNELREMFLSYFESKGPTCACPASP